MRVGLRITNYRKRAVIAFDVHAETVSIIGVFYGDQDYENVLREDSGEDDTEHVKTFGHESESIEPRTWLAVVGRE